MKWLIICGVLLSVHASLYAQKVVSRSELDSVITPKLYPQGDDILQFTSKEIDVGILSEDEPAKEYTFICKNISDKVVTLTKIRTSCGCTEAVAQKEVLLPDETTGIKVVYNPLGHPKYLYSRVFVYTDISGNSPLAVLALVGKVTPSAVLWKDYRYAMGSFYLRRKTVKFGKVFPTAKRVERISCINGGTEPVKVTAAKETLPPYMTVYTRPEILEASETGELLISVDGSKLPATGDKSIQVTVLLEGISVSPSERMLKISLELE